jgi:transcriptional regulator with XRE-family HTH domain
VASGDICLRTGKRIRRLRKGRGWNQDDLAAHTGFGRTYISNVERGEKNPSLRSLEVFAATFDLTLSQFFRDI